MRDFGVLFLDVRRCKQLADVAALGEGLGKLQALASLQVDFGGCSQLADVAALGEGFGKLPSLTALTLDFRSHAQHSLLRGQFFQLNR